MRRTPLVILMTALSAAPLFGAVPAFREAVACPPLRLRLPEGCAAEELPPTETFRYVRTWTDGRTEEAECYDPEQLWRAEQRLGLWKDREGNRFELLAPAARRGGPYAQKHVTREAYDAARAEALKPAEIGAWIGEWTGNVCGRPEALRPVGAVRQARFAVAGGDAVLLFYLKAEPAGPYVLRVTPADGNPADWKRALGQALGGFAPAGRRTPAAQTKGWIALERPPYRVYTDLPRKDHRALERLLEDMQVIREAYAALFPLPPEQRTPLSTIRIFARQADYRAYVGEGLEWSNGIFSTTKRELVVLADGDADADREARRESIRAVAFHEGFHQYLFLVTPTQAAVPTWFNEGHAAYFETFRIRGGKGEPTLSPRLETARRAEGMRSAKGLGALMNAPQTVFYGAGRDAAYAVSWLLIHWLRTEAPAGMRSLPDRYYALLCKGASPAEAQAKIFPAAVLGEIAEGLEAFLGRQPRGD